MINKFLLILTLICSYSLLNCQTVVVSEYYNLTGSPRGEWTELLVIKDNIDIVGFTLRDNVGTNGIPNSWQGGVRFRDVPLWRNLRSGTIIVINHRNLLIQNVDADKSDGYIELDAENDVYFEKRCFNCDLVTNWIYNALSIAQQADVIELLDANDVHVHALAHLPTPVADYLNMPYPKSANPGSMINASSLRVVPGNNIADYNSGFGNLSTLISTDYVTKGKPNLSLNSQNQNQSLWRDIRQPKWIKPTIESYIDTSGVKLIWNSSEDAFPADEIQGYIIFRLEESDSANSLTPVDGKIYQPGEKLGKAVVIENIKSSSKLDYKDTFKIPCGETYIYRVYAFRYGKDHLSDDAQPEFSRGRQYNELDFAETKVKNEIPEIPLIISELGINKICEGDSVKIISDLSLKQSYDWIKDGEIIPGEHNNYFYVKNTGIYRLKVSSNGNCSSYSEILNIDVVSRPHVQILNENNISIPKDTILYLCKNSQLILNFSGSKSYDIFKNKKPFNLGNSGNVIIDEPGIYNVVISNQNLCFDTSVSVIVKNIDVNFSLSVKKLNFKIDSNESFNDNNFTIKNLSEDTLVIENLNIPIEFKLLNSLPIIILPKSETILNVRFLPLISGEYKGFLIFNTQCGKSDSIELYAYKSPSTLVSDFNNIDYGLMISCLSPGKDTLITFSNSGSDTIKLYLPDFFYPFYVTDTNFPKFLFPGDSIKLNLRFSSAVDGFYSRTIKFPYSIKSFYDTLKVNLNGKVITPVYTIFPDNITFPQLLECQQYIDTLITITNTGETDIKIANPSLVPEVDFPDMPVSIKVGDSKVVRLRFQPKQIGNYDIPVTVLAVPCVMPVPIKVHGIKSGMVYYFVKDSIDFGTNISCQNNNLTRKIKLVVLGDSLKKAFFQNVSITGNFTTNAVTNSKLNDSNEISVTFKPNGDGKFSGQLKIAVQPCDFAQTIQLSGTWLTPGYSFDTKNLKYGKLIINNTANQNFNFINTGNTNLIIDSITGLKPPFFSNSFNYPNLTSKNDKLNWSVDYKPVNAGYDTNRLIFYMHDPCSVIDTIILSGSARGYDTVPITLILPQITSYPVEPFHLLIREIGDPLYLDSALITSFSLNFHLNERIFHPVQVYLGSSINQNSIIKLDMKQMQFGYYKISAEFNSPVKFKNGDFLELKGSILLGDSLHTEISLDSVQFNSLKPISTTIVNGDITLTGVCVINMRLVLQKSPDFDLRFNRANDALILNYNISDETNVFFKIYNSIGQEILKVNEGVKKPGNFEKQILFNEISSGLYFIIMNTTGTSKTKSIVK